MAVLTGIAPSLEDRWGIAVVGCSISSVKSRHLLLFRSEKLKLNRLCLDSSGILKNTALIALSAAVLNGMDEMRVLLVSRHLDKFGTASTLMVGALVSA